MQSDNDFNTTLADRNRVASDEQQDRTVQWLLDQDYAEPSEKLFTLSEDEHVLGALSDYEAEVANRPMFGGESSSDDLSSFVGEEIIMTTPGQAADIFSESATLAEAAQAMTVSTAPSGSGMAIDHSSYRAGQTHDVVKAMDEGSDILGLVDGDDIGERFLVMQKAKTKSSVKANYLKSSLLGTFFWCLSVLSHWDAVFILPVVVIIFFKYSVWVLKPLTAPATITLLPFYYSCTV